MSTPNTPLRAGYYPNLDGVRAIGALLIVFAHILNPLRLPILTNGWIAVSMFFVLSGFLITQILVETREAPNYFKAFYARRALRIFPIYYLAITLAWLWADSMGRDTSKAGPFFYYAQNFLTNRSPEGPFMEGVPWFVQHTWSLAVEEQFYLVMPLIVFFVPPRHLKAVLWSLLAGSIAFKAYHIVPANVRSVYLATHTFSCVELLAGGGLAGLYLKQYTPDRLIKWLGLGFLALIAIYVPIHLSLGWVGIFGREVVQPGSLEWMVTMSMVLVYSCFLAMVLCSARFGPRLMPFFANRPMRFIGKMSYGIYLYHPIVNTFIRRTSHKPGFEFLDQSLWLTTLIMVVSVLIVSTLSWYLIEMPLLNLKRYFPYRAKGAAKKEENLQPTS